jgi:hypothetical protein
MTTFYSFDELYSMHINGNLHCKSVENQLKSLPYQSRDQKPESFRNVHEYDGKQETVILRVPEELNKEEAIKKLIVTLNSEICTKIVTKIVTEKHFDNLNNVYTDELLYCILSKKISIDLFCLLKEQLEDIFILGSCPQGITTRLSMIYNAM